MIKAKLYNTPNSWWFVGTDLNKEYGWFSLYFLGKSLTFYWGLNTHSL